MNKAKFSEKIVKDLLFLLDLPASQLNDGITKYLDKEGDGVYFHELKIPCIAYFSVEIYDYQGKFYQAVPVNKLNNADTSHHSVSKGVIAAVNSMKLHEKAWFNIKNHQLHGITNLSTPGCHVRIHVNDFLFKNSDLVESKRLVSERNSEEGKKLFKDREYEEAMKKYRTNINITEGLEKKKYNEEELKEIDEINLKGKQNFLRCFIKIKDHDEALMEVAWKYVCQLFEREQSQLHYFLKSKVMIERKYVSDGVELAKEMLQKFPSQEAKELYEGIKRQTSKKN